MEKKSNFKSVIQNHKSEIIVGIITSAIWFFIELLIRIVPTAGETLIGKFSNYIYKSASHATSDNLMIIIFTWFTCIFILAVITPYIFIVRDKKQKAKEKEIGEYEAKLTEISENIDKYNSNPLKAKEVKEELNRISEGVRKYKLGNKKKQLNIILPIFVVMILVFNFITTIIPIAMSNEFKSSIKMIKPYTDLNTITMLESDWIRMQDKDDYNKIYDTINQIKEENNLTKD